MRHTVDDQALMLRYRDGDTVAFEQLYGRHKGPLYRYLLRHCGDPPAAEELFQEVWMKIIRARGNYRPLAKFTTWLYRIAHNSLVDRLRRQGRNALDDCAAIEPDTLGSVRDDPERSAGISEAGQRLAAALVSLPPEQREAFLLREEGGFGLTEIANITGVGRETVKSRLRYALRKLRKALEDNHD